MCPQSEAPARRWQGAQGRGSGKETIECSIEQEKDYDESDKEVDGDKARVEFITDDLAAKPTLESDQQESGHSGVEDAALVAVIAPGDNSSGENEKTDHYADESIDVFDPSQLKVK